MENNMIVYVEKKVLEDPAIASDESFGAVKKKFCTFREDYDDISNRIDFIICLGGDGTLLYASSLFQSSRLERPSTVGLDGGARGNVDTALQLGVARARLGQVRGAGRRVPGNRPYMLTHPLRASLCGGPWLCPWPTACRCHLEVPMARPALLISTRGTRGSDPEAASPPSMPQGLLCLPPLLLTSSPH
ncbi:hypothetical protein P7K49_015149 [Saguinus oedipus]|uniref:NAD(+) kinase n=1 Tax=Saguinus oedipus TaxID=9490 RepID=A0ABQ9V8F4_SAGOE|nr:hypothetical protein P7K49_015149 [Saguinus oedipus]